MPGFRVRLLRSRPGVTRYRARKETSLAQVGVFRMPVDIGLGEGAQRVDLQPLATGRIEHAADQRLADATPLELFGNLGVEHGQHPVVALVVGEGNMAIGFEFESADARYCRERYWSRHGLSTFVM